MHSVRYVRVVRISKTLVALVVMATTAVIGSAEPAAATSTFMISTFAGTGVQNYSGDGGPATSATMEGPAAVACDRHGNVFIVDTYDQVVRKVAANGTITKVAGTPGIPGGLAGDGGPANSASFNHPRGIAVDAWDRIYVADSDNNLIRRFDVGGTITTIAGTGSTTDSGDGGAALSAGIKDPENLTLDAAGNLYIGEFAGNRVRRVDTSGIITTVIGDGTGASSGDGGLATNAKIYAPYGMAVDASGNLYVVDGLGAKVRKIAVNGIVTTVAGNGITASAGDGGLATSASFNNPSGLAIDGAGNIYVAEWSGQRVRRIDASGNISTVVGTGTGGYSGDGGAATSAELNNPNMIDFDDQGNLYVSELGSFVIRKIALIGPATGESTVSVTIDPALTFTVAGRSSACNGVTPTAMATGSTVNMGHVTSATPASAAQDLAVTTNAAGGFVVYQRGNALTGPRAITSVVGTNASPGPFGSGEGFGYTTDDSNVAGFSGPKWAALSTTNAPVMSRIAAASGSNCVAYRIALNATTPAGNYSTTVVYTAVPLF